MEAVALHLDEVPESADRRTVDGEERDDATRQHQQKGLDHVGPDHRLEPAEHGVDAGDGAEHHDAGIVDEVLEIFRRRILHDPPSLLEQPSFRRRIHQQRPQGSSADVQRDHDLDDHHDDQTHDPVQHAGTLVVASAEEVRQRVHARRAIDGHQEIGEHQQPRDRAEFEVGLGEPLTVADAGKPYDMVRRNVGGKNRTGDRPPGNGAPGQEEVLGARVLARRPHADGHHAEDADDAHGQVETGEDAGQRSRSWRCGPLGRGRPSVRDALRRPRDTKIIITGRASQTNQPSRRDA